MCPNCGSAVNRDDYFCEACGTPLKTKTPPAASPRQCTCLPHQVKPNEIGFCENCGLKCVEALMPPQTVEVVDKTLAVVSDRGRKHHENEDAGTVIKREDKGILLVVSDGVSTSLNPASAADLATKTIRTAFANMARGRDALEVMQDAIEAAHQNIMALPDRGAPDNDGPEATVVAAYRQGKRLVYGWVGDSRVYVFNGQVKLLTRDDSWLEEVVRAGKMSVEQAMKDRRAHYVTQVLGMKDALVTFHVEETMIDEDATVIVCSDGLWNYFPTAEALAKEVKQIKSHEAKDICLQLVAKANALGGRDNITVAISLPEN